MEGVLKNLEDYWYLVEDVWTTGVLGHSVGDILIAIAIFGVFFVLRGLFTRFVIAVADRWVDRTETKIDDYIRDAIRNPLRFLFLALGFFFATEYLAFEDVARTFAQNLNRSLIIIAIFWALFNCVTPVSQGLKMLERLLTPEILNWLIAGAKTAVVLTRGGDHPADMGHPGRADHRGSRTFRRGGGAGRAGPLQEPDRRHVDPDRAALRLRRLDQGRRRRGRNGREDRLPLDAGAPVRQGSRSLCRTSTSPTIRSSTIRR